MKDLRLATSASEAQLARAARIDQYPAPQIIASSPFAPVKLELPTKTTQ